MNKLLLFALLALLYIPAPAHAQFAKPAGAPTVMVPDYDVTIGIWALDSLAGTYVGVFEYNTHDGKWYGFSYNGTSPSTSLELDVQNIGGPEQWIKFVALPALNAALVSRYPKIGTTNPPPAGANYFDTIQYLLQTKFAYKTVDGQITFAPK